MQQHRANQALSFSPLFWFPKNSASQSDVAKLSRLCRRPRYEAEVLVGISVPCRSPSLSTPLPESGGRWLTRASECPARPSVKDSAQHWFSCSDDSGKERTCSRPEGEKSLVPVPGRRALSVWCPGRLAKGDGDRSPLRAEPRIPRALLTGPALTPPQTEGQPHSRGLFAVRDCVPRDRNRSWVVFGAFLTAENLLQRRKSPLTRGRLEQPSHRPGGGCSAQAGGELEGQPPAGQGNACAPHQEPL